MRDLSLKTVLVLLSLLSVSCSKANQEGPHIPEVDELTQLTCEYPEVLGQDSYGASRCVDSTIRNVCMESQLGFLDTLNSEDETLFDSCLYFKKEISDSHEKLKDPGVMILMNTGKTEKRKFARWADQNISKLKNIKSFPTAGIYGEYLVVGKPQQNTVFLGILNPLLMPTTSQGYLVWPMAPKYFREVADLILYLENDDSATVPFNTNSEDIQVLLNLIPTRPSVTMFKTYSSLGCAISCIKKSDVINTGRGLAQYNEYYSHSKVYRSEWVLLDKNKHVKSMVYMAGSQPSLAITIQRNSYGLPLVTKLFDRKNNLVYKQKRNFNTSGILAERDLIRAVDNSNLSPVGLCEDSIDFYNFQSLGLGYKILLGPSLDESFYGWFEKINHKNKFWTGRIPFNAVDLPINVHDLGKHALNVTKALSERKSVGIIPLTADACIDPRLVKGWWSNFKEKNARVVNFSASSLQDKEKCKKVMRDHPMLKEPEAALWVVAAGNQGSNKAMACPQFLSGRDNLIIVGASQYSSEHPRSNYGKNYVDIYTSGKVNNAWGTSFAAPRVSAVAAEIFKKFPELSPLEVKLAILLSADRIDLNLSSRSKGLFEAEASLELAKEISDADGDIEKALGRMYCTWSSSCSQSKKRYKIYKKIIEGGQ